MVFGTGILKKFWIFLKELFSKVLRVKYLFLSTQFFFGKKIRFVCVIRWGKNNLAFESNLNKIDVLNIIKSNENHPNFKNFWDHVTINLIEVLMNYFLEKKIFSLIFNVKLEILNKQKEKHFLLFLLMIKSLLKFWSLHLMFMTE